MSKFPSGVITGDGVQAIFNDAQENEYALPAVNVVGTNSVNAVLETAAAVNSPVMVQFSNGGGSFFAGNHLIMLIRNLQLRDQFLVLCMSIKWQKHMVSRLFCTLIMQLENFSLGWMECWMQVKNFMSAKVSLFTVPYA